MKLERRPNNKKFLSGPQRSMYHRPNNTVATISLFVCSSSCERDESGGNEQPRVAIEKYRLFEKLTETYRS